MRGWGSHIATCRDVFRALPAYRVGYVVPGCVFTPRKRKALRLGGDTQQNSDRRPANEGQWAEDTSLDIGCGDTPKNDGLRSLPAYRAGYVVTGCVFTPRKLKAMQVCEDTHQNIQPSPACGGQVAEDTGFEIGCEDTPRNIGGKDTPRDLRCEDTPNNTNDTPKNESEDALSNESEDTASKVSEETPRDLRCEDTPNNTNNTPKKESEDRPRILRREDIPRDVRCEDTPRNIGRKGTLRDRRCEDTPKKRNDAPKNTNVLRNLPAYRVGYVVPGCVFTPGKRKAFVAYEATLQHPVLASRLGPSFRNLSAKLLMGLLLSLAWPLALFAQDLETLGEQKIFAYNGSLSATQTFYHAEGMPSRRDPYFWQLNANLNLTLLGIINVPLSATLSQQNKSFAQPQPFNRFGISPTYKGLTVHLGHRSINFSDYTLAGNLFFGAGLEYKPENNPLRVSAMYGRLAKPVAKFSQFGQVYAEPTYRRMGFGTKLGFELEQQRAALMFFRAYDNPNSIEALDSSFVVTPEENLVLGLEGGFKFFDRFSLEGEYAYSLFTRDRRMAELFSNDYSFINNLGGLYKPNGSSAFTNALKSRLSYQGDGFQANLSYRRVDPGYTTHGSSFLNNDLEDITAGISLPLFNNRLTLATSSGLQHNNLDNQNSAQVNRWVFSSSASLSATEKLNINLNVSNFSTSTRQLLLQADLLSDTLEFFQVTRSAMAAVNYQTGKETNTGTLFVSGNLQDATDNQGNGSLFKSGNAGYSFKIGEFWSTNTSFTVNQSEAGGISHLTLGPVLGVNRSFMDNKVRSSLSLSLLNSYLNQSKNSHIDNVRWSVNWTAGKRHTVSLNTFYLLKNAYEETTKATQEWRGTLNYGIRL